VNNRLLIPILIAASSASALAGYKQTSNVVIYANGVTQGSMGTARNSADTLQYIGCEIYASTSYSNLHCRARDAAGAVRHCWNDARANDDMRQAIQTMTANSWLRFDVNLEVDPTKCTFIHVVSSSQYAPPQL
jgi:hypothetical protein